MSASGPRGSLSRPARASRFLRGADALRPGSFGAAVLAAATVSVGAALGQEPPPAPVPTPPAAELPATVPVTAKSSPTGETIVGIRVVGYQTVSPDTIAHYLGIKVGDPYDPETIRGNFQKL